MLSSGENLILRLHYLHWTPTMEPVYNGAEAPDGYVAAKCSIGPRRQGAPHLVTGCRQDEGAGPESLLLELPQKHPHVLEWQVGIDYDQPSLFFAHHLQGGQAAGCRTGNPNRG